ncbi:hypothetical protein Ddye_024011, partial [Dipteronia dyeriana]
MTLFQVWERKRKVMTLWSQWRQIAGLIPRLGVVKIEKESALPLCGLRYPELAAMARDVLSVPISTVASESAFSMGGRVLDQFRSSLLPNVAEALVCSCDWILGNGESAILKCEEITKDLWEMEDDSTPASTQTMHDQSSIQ